MKIEVNGREIRAPWPTASSREPHGCFGRPAAHPMSASEHLLAYFQALDTSETTEHWEALAVRLGRVGTCNN